MEKVPMSTAMNMGLTHGERAHIIASCVQHFLHDHPEEGELNRLDNISNLILDLMEMEEVHCNQTVVAMLTMALDKFIFAQGLRNPEPPIISPN